MHSVYSVCMLLSVSVRVCTVLYVPCPSQLQKSSGLNSHETSLPKLLSDKCGAAHFPSHTQIVCKGPASFMFPSVGSLLPPHRQICRPLSGFIGSFILQRARSLSLYGNSSAFCPTPLWILICMWTHCVVELGHSSTKEENNFKCGWGLKDFFCLMLVFQSVAGKDYRDLPVKRCWRTMAEDNIFVQKLHKTLFCCYNRVQLMTL